MNEQQQIKELLQSIPQDLVEYGQAISVCSVFAELQQLKADKEELVDSLFERFQGFVEKFELSEQLTKILKYAIKIGLIEQKEENLYSPTHVGMVLGKDWLKQVQLSQNI